MGKSGHVQITVTVPLWVTFSARGLLVPMAVQANSGVSFALEDEEVEP